MNGILITMTDINKGPRLPVGTRVSYGDRANPRQVAVVVSEEIEGVGQPCIFVDDHHKGHVSEAVIESPGGWQLEQGQATQDDVANLKQKHEEYLKHLHDMRWKGEQRQKEKLERGKAFLSGKIPKWAKSVLVAEHEVDDCDIITDYFNTKTNRMIILAWSKHNRDIFSEMRKAALNCNIPEVRALADAPKNAEHREKYSMGAGYYLKAQHRYNTGWKIEKRSLSWGTDRLFDAVGESADNFQVPENGNGG